MSENLQGSAASGVTELKVTAHLMQLDAGLFCVYNTPGSPAPDASTGLPGVRISPAPLGGSGVSISTFAEDGWLGPDGAALIRLQDGPGQVLVTIYHDPAGARPAPQLQFTKLSDPSPPQPVQLMASTAPPEPPPPDIAGAQITAHLQSLGDVPARLGDWVGQPSSGRWIEGFALDLSDVIGPEDIEYQAVLGRGWLSPWATGGEYCGSRGMALPILGLRIRLRPAASERFVLELSASFVDGVRVGPVASGEPCEAGSLAPLEAFRIVLKSKDGVEVPAGPAPAQVDPPKDASKSATRKRRG